MIKKALQRISDFYDSSDMPWVQELFGRVERIPGANRLFIRITSASNKDQLDDYFAEVIYALVFTGLGFQVEIEPLGHKGPDLKVLRDNHKAVVEISRFRKIYHGPPELDMSGKLSDYGNPNRDIRKSFGKILSKFQQIGNEPSIIAIWNDDGDLEEKEVEIAVRDICTAVIQRVLEVPDGLLFIIYGSPWIRMEDHKQIYCFPVKSPEQSYQVAWQHELNTSIVKNLMARAVIQ